MRNELYKDVLLEIALSISGEFQLDRLLKGCIPLFLRKLDCTSCAVLSQKDETFDIEMVMPKAMASSDNFQEDLKSRAQDVLSHVKQEWMDVPWGNRICYGFRMPEFGVLFLIRSTPFEKYFINEFLPLVKMLTRACRSCIEVRKRLEAEQLVLTQKAHFESLFTNTNDAMVYFDENNKIFNINRKFTAMFGYELDEIMGRDINLVVDPEKREHEYGSQKILSGKNIEMEAVRYTRTGKALNVLLKGGPVHVKDRLSGGYAIYYDITEKKKAEKELLEALKNARAASKAKSEFLANMSHEIRTPLNGVVSMINLIEETELTAEQREYLDMAVISADSLLGIINDILDFSKIEAGKMELAARTFDLEHESGRVMAILSGRTMNKDIELITRFDVNAPRMVVADNLRLRQILFNLGGNAIKFTESGHILLDIRCVHRGSDHARFRFSIKDTGIGIPKEKHEEIFEHFTQADYSSTRRFGGTGLGLAISRHLTRIMGGELKVNSTPGQGAEFYFEIDLPLASDQEFEKAPPALSGLNALVVDDNKINLRIISESLKSWGIEVKQAQSALQALDILKEMKSKEQKPDIIITDHAMPEMDGLEMAFKIKKDSYWKDIPLIALSSFWGNVKPGRFYENGFSSFLPKPVNRSDLMEVIINCLNGLKEGCQQAAKNAPGRVQKNKSPGLSKTKGITLKNVLVAEDNHINRKSIQMMLRDLAEEIKFAENGLQAVDMFKKDTFELILMDVQMPVMDGLDAVREIRKFETEQGQSDRQAPIIALTANAMPGDREKCINAGMSDYLAKPVRKNDLLNIISRHIQAEEKIADHTPPPSRKMETSAVDHRVQSDASIFNSDEFMSRYDHDLDIAQEIMRDFLEDLPGSLSKIQRAADNRLDQETEKAAHKLKGSAAYVEALKIVHECEQIMWSALMNEWDDVYQSIDVLKAEVEIFQKQCAGFFKKHGIIV
ncbi:MAG: response regulator [Desulfonatronovibrio sp. MSAO_Bac4]|nr:MAG: response regulator [Desulfonatronovibrio sp. MSAO_Bac4]